MRRCTKIDKYQEGLHVSKTSQYVLDTNLTGQAEKTILRQIMNGLDLSAGYGGRATRRRGGVTIWKELSDPAFS